MEFDIIHNACLTLKKGNCLKTRASIVLTSNLEEMHTENKQLYYDKRAELENTISNIQEDIASEKIRVNAVVYDESNLDLTPVTGSGQEWIEKYLEENCPLEMKRAQFLGKAFVYLLSGDSQFTNGSIISINI